MCGLLAIYPGRVSAAEASIREAVAVARPRPTWWKQVVYILVLYGIYSAVRNYSGSVLSIQTATDNAFDIVNFQNQLGMISEQSVQAFFLAETWFIKFLNVFYGTAHFIVTIGVLVWLYTHQVERFIHWRNVIFGTSAMALVGYTLYPLAPPRLLPESYGFVDTLETVGGLWSFESGAVQDISNQYAAMPSLHVAWALWCALAIMPVLRHTVSKLAIALYPALTILTIVVTGNHYWMDVVGGCATFGAGYLLATGIERWTRRRRGELDPGPGPVTSEA